MSEITYISLTPDRRTVTRPMRIDEKPVIKVRIMRGRLKIYDRDYSIHIYAHCTYIQLCIQVLLICMFLIQSVVTAPPFSIRSKYTPEKPEIIAADNTAIKPVKVLFTCSSPFD